MALLQNKSLFQVLRVDFLTLVWCAHIMIEFECWSYKEVQSPQLVRIVEYMVEFKNKYSWDQQIL